MMVLLCALLAVCLAGCLRDVRVSACDDGCADKPVFTPPRLVVKFGDPTSATCLVCQAACPENFFGLEKSVGVHSTKGPTISWTVARMTEWDPSPKCYYNADAKKCCSTLPVTVYKPPDRVSIGVSNAPDMMLEGHQYSLNCTVENVAPVKNAHVTFYKGTSQMGPPVSKNEARKTPVTETYMANIRLTKEDDKAQFWCEAKLELGSAGPQPPPVVKSNLFTARVQSRAVALIPSVSMCLVVSSLSLVCSHSLCTA